MGLVSHPALVTTAHRYILPPMNPIALAVVCCESNAPHHSRIVDTTMPLESLEARVIRSTEQKLGAGEARELHNAAHDPEHGPVTYVQEVHEGGFSVFTGPTARLEERFFGPGTFVAFMDDRGPGHASRVGPEGVRRTLRVLKGHLTV